MISFSQYLIESTKFFAKMPRNFLFEEYKTLDSLRNNQDNEVQISLQEVLDFLENECNDTDILKLVDPTRNQIKNFRDEFNWMVGSNTAGLQANDSDNEVTCQRIMQDIHSIESNLRDQTLDQITVKVLNFLVDGRREHESLAIGKTSDSNVVYIGVECNSRQLQRWVEQQAAQPNDDTTDEVNGVHFREVQEVDVNSADSFPLILGKWDYQAFLQIFQRLDATTFTYFAFDGQTTVKYKKIDWDDNVDSFVKRLGMMLFKKSADSTRPSVMQLTFNGHKTIASFDNSDKTLVQQLTTLPCSSWYKKITKFYFQTYKLYSGGIEILYDPDHFFANSPKYRIQQPPPFKVGLAVNRNQNATPVVRPAQNNQPARRPNQQNQTQAAELQLQQELSQIAERNDLTTISMHFGIPSTKNKMARIFGAGGPWTMFINFPGLDKETKIIGDEAVSFLKQYHLWDGAYKDVYDRAKQAHDDLRLAIMFNGTLK